MGKHKIREDKTCLNCNHVAELRFCPNCGQENTETRKTFHHLFVHFFEDLTHYENAFWKTLRNLLFRPASLSKEYLSGKRISYLAPVRLYIFISFVTFFVISVLPDKKEAENPAVPIALENQKQALDKKELFRKELLGYTSVKELDSLQKYGKADERLSDWQYSCVKHSLTIAGKYSLQELKEKFLESFFHNFPKVLFIYMPLFALVLWVFQDKKKWYYFDHGIFTLHYFSFLLIVRLIRSLGSRFFELFGENAVATVLSGMFNFALGLYMIYYFFPAHHRFYGETRTVSIIKGTSMFFINMFFIGIILLLYAIYTFLTIH